LNGFDLVVLLVLALWAVHGLVRGIIRAVIGLAAWVVGFFAAVHLAAPVAGWLPDFRDAPSARYWIAFVVVLLAVLIVGAIVGAALARLAQAIGLGFLDRLFGAAFGLICGVVFALIFAFVAGLTGMAKRDWWQNSHFGPALASGVLALTPWLPPAWAGRLEFPGVPAPRPGVAA
jgi:membrane protein required for colicin V production